MLTMTSHIGEAPSYPAHWQRTQNDNEYSVLHDMKGLIESYQQSVDQILTRQHQRHVMQVQSIPKVPGIIYDHAVYETQSSASVASTQQNSVFSTTSFTQTKDTSSDIEQSHDQPPSLHDTVFVLNDRPISTEPVPSKRPSLQDTTTFIPNKRARPELESASKIAIEHPQESLFNNDSDRHSSLSATLPIRPKSETPEISARLTVLNLAEQVLRSAIERMKVFRIETGKDYINIHYEGKLTTFGLEDAQSFSYKQNILQWYTYHAIQATLISLKVPHVSPTVVQMFCRGLFDEITPQTERIVYVYNINNMHWVTIVCQTHPYVITYMDSYKPSHPPSKVVENVKEHSLLHLAHHGIEAPTTKPSIHVSCSIKQKGTTSCGPYVVREVERILHQDVSADQGNPIAIRARHAELVANLIAGRLVKDTDVETATVHDSTEIHGVKLTSNNSPVDASVFAPDDSWSHEYPVEGIEPTSNRNGNIEDHGVGAC
ncbi:uncharacterized protein KY384_001065 [Bacidia gigantensis]|uniref:uncharacterized protein n=1 Tax=Bacidia gigantensis TaxID=2732470 RepID=UPI001D03C54A|nr:uncharacterized protein KY384_001065 [Bacidia gigantensis]KAG8534221.1 hypothetical protein KY384_001065 [Bacidia gigantensis]